MLTSAVLTHMYERYKHAQYDGTQPALSVNYTHNWEGSVIPTIRHMLEVKSPAYLIFLVCQMIHSVTCEYVCINISKGLHYCS
jgi:hypothetical protein